MDAVVDGANRLFHTEEPQQGCNSRERSPHAAREDDEPAHHREDDERKLDPEVRTDVVPPDRQCESDRCQGKRRSAAERPFQQHGAYDCPGVALMSSAPLVDPRCVATKGCWEYLAGRVRD